MREDEKQPLPAAAAKRIEAPPGPSTLADFVEARSPGSLQSFPAELQQIFQVTRLEASVTHSGPLPAPWVIAEYCKYIPNAGERLMVMAENQSAHRIQLEKLILPKQIAESGRGQALAAVLAFAALFVTAWLGYLHETAAACTVGGATVVTLAASFIGGKTAVIKNLVNKQSAQRGNPSPSPAQDNSVRILAAESKS